MEMLANGSTDGFILSVAKETQQKGDYHHLLEVINQAVQHLIDIQCRNIALITTVDYVSVGKLRTQGYLEALEENGMQANEELILKVEDFDHSEEEIKKFLSGKKIDGVFAVNEHFAIYAVKAFNENGLKVPDDVSVVGFTNGELSKLFIPSLTTVSQHGAEMGAQAARLLIKKLESEEGEDGPYETIIVETSLIQRNSTKR